MIGSSLHMPAKTITTSRVPPAVTYPLLILLVLTISLWRVPRAAAEEKVTLASFSTSIAGQDDGVKRNIRIACDKINGSVIPSGSIFSFNDVVGEGSAKNGFAPGRVLYRDRTAMEAGGGLCQVSSTLFNALLMAGCIIMERHRHFQPVTYVPLGLDATIKYGKKDLRMKNPHAHHLNVEIRASDSSLMVVITAEQKPPFRYEIYTEENVQAVPFADESERIRRGITVHVYRKRFRGNTLLESALLYRDYYPPVYIR